MLRKRRFQCLQTSQPTSVYRHFDTKRVSHEPPRKETQPLGLFETPEQGMESTKLVTTWIREEKLDTILPNAPKITSGKIVAHSDRVLVAA